MKKATKSGIVKNVLKSIAGEYEKGKPIQLALWLLQKKSYF
jgi:hypothetical protein